ncbi:MAG: ABC transporter permease [Myxococcales bacterium]|nr:ABC transporter permease [Myxococcales bacterium]
MAELSEAFATALRLLVTFDRDLVEIVLLSLRVSLLAVLLAAGVGLPLGATLASTRFPGRSALTTVLNALMGLPPVVVGLAIYLLLSRSGPLGELNLLFTPTAMIVAQFVLITPIVAALSRDTFESLWDEYGDQLRSLGASRPRALTTLLFEGRAALSVAILAGLGRAIAEVGAVQIVGGNIAHSTRVMTTAIALETSRGDLPLALGLGILLVALSIFLNGAAYGIRQWLEPSHG